MTSILILLSKIMVGYDKNHSVELEGADTIQWGDSDPWVPIEIPGAEYVSVFQHIKPVRIEGSLTCFDAAAIRKVFFQTDVQKASGVQYAISSSGQRKRIEYFHVLGIDHKGSEKEYSLVGVRIRNIEFPAFSKNEAEPRPFTVHFFAEYIEEA